MTQTNSKIQLERKLGFPGAFALVVGSIIGTGVFLKTATMTQQVGGLTWVLLAWLVAGILSFLGTLVYSELSSRFPDAGGEYVFLRESYGETLGFLYGWTRFWIASPASIAAYAVGATTFLNGISFRSVSLPGLSFCSSALCSVFISLVNEYHLDDAKRIFDWVPSDFIRNSRPEIV